MNVQILALRPSTNNPEKLTEKFYERKWRAESVADIFKDHEKVLEQIPEAERFQLYYTTCECFEERGRKLKIQHTIPFDIDHIDLTRIPETVETVLQALEVDASKVGVMCSGYGIQVQVGIMAPITSTEYFAENKHHYKAITDRVNKALAMKQLPGKADTSVFSAARLMRLPGTINAKPGRERKPAFLIHGNISPIDYDIAKISRLPTVEAGDAVSSQAFARWPKPDTKAVLTGCKFLEHMLENPNEIAENQWYAGLSILGNLEQGDILAQEYSKGHKQYNFHETQNKLKQAMDASGPRTCKNIDTLWDGCSTCPHNGKLSSPVQIKGANFIKTQSTGFYNIKLDANGEPKIGAPNYTDLRKFFETKYPYMVTKETKMLYIFDGKKWKLEPQTFFEAFAEEHFDPKPLNKMCAEFVGALYRNNIRSQEDLLKSTHRKVNFQNGVLDIVTNDFVAHSQDFGFMYVLPYDYDPKATAPRWDQFMEEITCGRPEVAETLLEYAGYSISGDTCWAQKALMLLGNGANGKSTFMNTLKNLVGEKNASYLSMSHIVQPVFACELIGKLFNMTEETDMNELLISGPFKNIVAGGKVSVRFHYRQPQPVSTNVKLMFACNTLPKITDLSDAMFRRLLIVPFDAKFEGKADRRLEDKLVAELPGIFNQVLAAYRNLCARDFFNESKYIKDLKEKIKEENDIAGIGEWVDVRLEVTPSESLNCVGTTINELYRDYEEFAEQAGERPANRKLFQNRISKLIHGYELRKGDRLRTEKYGRSTLLRGIVIDTKNWASQ